MKRLLFTLALALAVLPTLAQPVKGTYSGLFFDTNGIAPQSSGYFTIATTISGTFSGKLLLSGTSISFKGTFDGTGKTNLNLAPRHLNPMNLALQQVGTDRIIGSLTDGTWTAQLAGDRAVFDGKTSLAPQAGRYTLVIPGNYGSTQQPAGDGYGTLTVDKAGRLKLSGSLADGTKLSQSATVSTNGQWPFYLSLYGGQGSMLGWIQFSNDPGHELSGALNWFKPVVPKAILYPAGFTNQPAARGAAYHPPAKGTAVMSFITGECVFQDGNLIQPITNEVVLDANNQVRNFSSNKLSVTFTASTGAFKGRATDPITAKTISFGGVALQGLSEGSGWFAGTNQSGQVRLSAEPGDVVDFVTLGSSFAPEVYFAAAPDHFRWSWSDGTFSTNAPVASKNLGGKGARHQYLTAYPGGTLFSINVGFDGSDGGENTPLTNRPAQNIGAVRFPYPLTQLRYWASLYSSITSGLDFTGFTNLQSIECFHCANLGRVVITNLPSLNRICFEACDLQELDLTSDAQLADVRAAVNVFTNVVMDGVVGPNIWHWCTRNNPNLTQRFQDLMTNFYSLQELWVWDDNQNGALTVISTNLTSVKANDNNYTSADFSGQVHLTECWLFNNSLTNLVLTGCAGLQDLQAYHNDLSAPALDALLMDLDLSGNTNLIVNLTNNAAFPSVVGLNAYTNLINKGVVVLIDVP